jgi:hypothetical protein
MDEENNKQMHDKPVRRSSRIKKPVEIVNWTEIVSKVDTNSLVKP